MAGTINSWGYGLEDGTEGIVRGSNLMSCRLEIWVRGNRTRDWLCLFGGRFGL